MEILGSLDQAKIAIAWFNYIRRGMVCEDLLRPIIARSWNRSPKLEYSKYLPNKPIPSSMQQVLHRQNYQIIHAASTIMEYLFYLEEDSIVKLSDGNGYTIKSFQKYGEIVDTCYAEDHVGPNAAGLILVEGTANVIGGFEYLKVNWHSSFSGGIPIKNSKGDIIAMLCVSTLGRIPNISLELLEKAGLIIKECLSNNLQYEVETSKYFGDLINSVNDGLLIVEKNGRIVTANEQLWNSFDIKNKNLYLNEHLSKLIDNKSASNLLSENVNDTNVIFTTKIENTSKSFFQTKSINIIHHDNGEDYILILLKDNFLPANDAIPQKVNTSLNIDPLCNIIGQSSPINRLKQSILKVAKLPSTILIQGESGTGKELIANAIHKASGRQGPFIPVNCGAIPKELLESELFGYDEGSFTGALKGGKKGKFEIAHKGTLFLDEIGEMPIDMQVALLRFLEDKVVIRMGASEPIKTDVRIIAATNRDLVECISSNTFRQDLYYRLNVINLFLPPLINLIFLPITLVITVFHFVNEDCFS